MITTASTGTSYVGFAENIKQVLKYGDYNWEKQYVQSQHFKYLYIRERATDVKHRNGIYINKDIL